MNTITIIVLFGTLGVITGLLVALLGKVNDLAFKLEYTRSCAIESINRIEDLKETVAKENDFYLDIMKRSLESDEKFGKGISETLSSMVENIRDRDEKIVDVIKTMHTNMESIRSYVAELSDRDKINDERWELIFNYIRERKQLCQAPDLDSWDDAPLGGFHSLPDEGG